MTCARELEWVPDVTTHEDVVTSADWVLENGRWAQVDIGIVAWRLVGGAAVKVPLLELLHVSDLVRACLGDVRGRKKRAFNPRWFYYGVRHLRRSRCLISDLVKGTPGGHDAHSAWMLSPWSSDM